MGGAGGTYGVRDVWEGGRQLMMMMWWWWW